jgi:hypothetical protein
MRLFTREKIFLIVARQSHEWLLDVTFWAQTSDQQKVQQVNNRCDNWHWSGTAQKVHSERKMKCVWGKIEFVKILKCAIYSMKWTSCQKPKMMALTCIPCTFVYLEASSSWPLCRTNRAKCKRQWPNAKRRPPMLEGLLFSMEFWG